MAENSVIISAEEEAKLLKPIDEYVEKIQKKIDALRVDGSDKVNDLKNQIAIAKENKNLSKIQRDKIIENSKKELESAKKVETATQAKGMNIISNMEEVSGQTVFHTHVHIIPRYSDQDELAISFTEHEPNFEQLAVLAETIKNS